MNLLKEKESELMQKLGDVKNARKNITKVRSVYAQKFVSDSYFTREC